jgi:hypothetical protein
MSGLEKSMSAQRLESRRSKPLDRKGNLEIIRNFQHDFSLNTNINCDKTTEKSQCCLSGLVEIKPKSHLEEKYTTTQLETAL